MLETVKRDWKPIIFQSVVTAFAFTVFLIAASLALGSRSTTQDTLNANLAQACVLALPVTDEGRDPELVEECFTQYDLEPPTLVHEGP